MALRRALCAVIWLSALPLQAAPPQALTLMLDPGHTPAQPGALGVRGVHEVVYNDHFAARLAESLRAAGFRVELTRRPGESVGLPERAERARAAQADLFLSVHHDSAQPSYLEAATSAAGPAWRTRKAIRGYSLFVSQRNPEYTRSRQAADRLGEHLLSLGRPPTLHHAEPIAGENRQLLDRRLGIYRFDDLVVLARTTMPAVLLEVGVIVDDEDEAWVTQDKHQRQLCKAITEALLDWAAGLD